MAKHIITPPMNDEALENKLVALAFEQAKAQMQEGHASSQIVTHFLRLGSIKAKIELEKLELENRLLEERIQAEQAGQKLNEMFGEVLAALKSYSYAPPGDSNENLF